MWLPKSKLVEGCLKLARKEEHLYLCEQQLCCPNNHSGAAFWSGPKGLRLTVRSRRKLEIEGRSQDAGQTERAAPCRRMCEIHSRLLAGLQGQLRNRNLNRNRNRNWNLSSNDICLPCFVAYLFIGPILIWLPCSFWLPARARARHYFRVICGSAVIFCLTAQITI